MAEGQEIGGDCSCADDWVECGVLFAVLVRLGAHPVPGSFAMSGTPACAPGDGVDHLSSGLWAFDPPKDGNFTKDEEEEFRRDHSFVVYGPIGDPRFGEPLRYRLSYIDWLINRIREDFRDILDRDTDGPDDPSDPDGIHALVGRIRGHLKN